jgi:CubicO group peptidase (beta-lactamase class C family)
MGMRVVSHNGGDALSIASVTELTEQTRAELDRIIAGKQREGRVPGIVGAVVRKGDLAWSRGIGVADLDEPDQPPTADTQFLIASLSKTFVAVQIMQLRDEGRLSLDDPIEKFIAESKHTGITIRQMLSHVSGMQREPVGDVWDVLKYPDREQLVAGWNEAERVLPPHHRHHYSNLVYSMLGEIIARLDGKSWFGSLESRILDPLEMRRTTLGLHENAALGYYVPPFSDVPVKEPVLDIAAMASAGALASTAEDLAKWAAFLADPVDEVLRKDTVEEMCQPQIMADLERWTLAWGLGLMLLRVGERIFTGHTGSMPGHISAFFVHRESGHAGICLMNSISSGTQVDPSGLATELAVKVLDNDPLPREPWKPGVEVPAEFDGLLGTWFSEGQPFVFSVCDGRLEARGVTAPAHKPPSVFARLDGDLYRTESGREQGELLRITRDDDGVPVKLNWATYIFTRQPYAFGEWL